MDNKNSGFRGFILSPLGKAVMIVALYVMIWGIVLLLIDMNMPDAVVLIMAAVFGYFGWKSLDRVTPNIFLIMPIGGWLLYYLIKGILSIVIGMFVAPFVIAKMIASVVQESIE